MTIETPMPASTVVLCNVTTKWPHKILLVKRSGKARFLPGAHVFPGGSLEPKDHEFGTFLARDEKNIARITSYFSELPEMIAAHISAAIRETLEESGISLLRYYDRDSTSSCSSAMLKELFNGTNASHKPSLENLWPISWWITPAGETRRFNTWFFLATVTSEAVEDGFLSERDKETEDHLWLSPTECLARYREKQIFLAPPTRSILERMAVTATLEEFLTFVDRPLFPIKPQFIAGTNDQKYLVLPGDPLHQDRISAKMPPSTRYEFP